jgi:lipopolysaccharide export system permease protein
LDRYVIRELFIPFLIGTVVVVMMFQANAYIYIAKTFNVQNIPLVARFQWIMYETPSYMKMTLPVGMALAAALAMTRMTRESELTALRAAGTRIMRVILPIFVFGAFVGLVNFYIVDRVVPKSTHKAKELEQKNAFLGMAGAMKSNSFLQLQNYAASLGTVTREKNDALTISDVLLIERNSAQRTTIIRAGTGRYDQGNWTFSQAQMYVFAGSEVVTFRPLGQFVIVQPVSLEQIFAADVQTDQEDLPTQDLKKMIASALATKADARPAQIELQERYAIPASCAIFAITSSIFAFFFGRSGGFAGVLVSFFIVVLYYNAFVISTAIIGKLDQVPPWLAAWLPNILFGALGLLAIRRLE